MSDLSFEFEKSVGYMCKYVPTWDLEYLSHISLKHKYLFVETPKVACSTIKRTLQSIEYENPDFKHKDFVDVHKREYSPLLRPSQTEDYPSYVASEDVFKFCFVRNPYTRLLSAYLDKIRGEQEKKYGILLQTGRDMTDYEAEIPFHEFVHAICEQPFSAMDIHWRPQYYQTFQDSINYDLVGRFESFSTDFENVITRVMKGDSEVARSYLKNETRHATNASEMVRKFYGLRLSHKVYNKYKIDFEAFGYGRRLPE